MFVADELSLMKQGEQTNTAKVVVKASESLTKAKDFVIQDAARFITGDTTKTEIFFEMVGNFVEADFERFTEGQPTVIGTAIADDFKALASMTPEQLAAHLGHEAGDALLMFLGGGALQVGGRTMTKAMDTAINLSKELKATRTFRSPLLFQFHKSTIYSGFPVDAVKMQKPIVGKTTTTEVIIKEIVQDYGMPKLPVLGENLTKGQIIDYLQNIDKIPLKQLTADLERLGFELYEPPVDGIYKLIHWRNDIRLAHELKGIDIPIHTYVKPKLENSKFIIEIHKGNGGLDYDHMHITDANGNVYDKYLNNLTAKIRKDNPGWHAKKLQDKVERLPEAHIKIREFVELHMRPENV